MSEQLISSVVTVAVAIIGVAFIAVLVSKNANTAGVLTAGGSSLATALSAAEAPVTGSSGNSLGSLTGFTGQGGAGLQDLAF